VNNAPEQKAALPPPLRVPKFTSEQFKKKYKFDVKQQSERDLPESKLDQFKRLQEAHILMNALPTQIRKHEMEMARKNMISFAKLKTEAYGFNTISVASREHGDRQVK